MTRQPAAPPRVYFSGLHGLRFIAALLVVIGHVELLKAHHGLPNRAEDPVIYELGRIAVTFFFVLSGFLITYLLLVEKGSSGSIALQKFYARRILRIWPLYFLGVAVSFFVLPRLHVFDIPELSATVTDHFWYTLPLYLAMLPQVALSLFAPVPYAEPLWSIGVEEQFYLAWPLLLNRITNVVPWFLGIAAAGVAAKQGALLVAGQAGDAAQLQRWNDIIDYFYYTSIDCMAIGGLAAWLAHHRPRKLLAFLFNRITQLAICALVVYVFLTPRGKPMLHYTLQSCLFAAFILNTAANPRSLIRLEGTALTWLGNISYAMYVFHEVAIKAVIEWLRRSTGTTFETLGANAALYAASIALTILLAAAVFRFFERPFLRLKQRYAVVPSGPAPGVRSGAL